MPVIRDISLDLTADEVLRQTGINHNSKFKPKVESLIAELLYKVNADHLLEPTMAYEVHPITAIHADSLCINDTVIFQSSLLPSLLADANELAVVFCTIGPDLEQAIADYDAKNELLRASLLDSLGSAAVDVLAVEAYHLIQRASAAHGYAASSPISPGMSDFSLSEQRRMSQLVPIEQIGVQLTSSGMMMPRKSFSMVIGFGAEMPNWSRAEACARCNLAKSCRYKVHPQT